MNLGLDPHLMLNRAADGIFMLFGGVRKFDVWLTSIADFLAKPGEARPPELQLIGFRTHVPDKAMVDFILESLDKLSPWGYRVEITRSGDNVRVAVFDETWGHLVELSDHARKTVAEISAEYAAQYGPKVRVVTNGG